MRFLVSNPLARWIGLAFALDLVALAAAGSLGAALLGPDGRPASWLLLAVPASLLVFPSMQICGLYSPAVLSRPGATIARIGMLGVVVAATLCLGSLAFDIGPHGLRAAALALGGFLVALALGRLIPLLALRRPGSHERVVVVGINGLARGIAQAIAARPRRGVTLVGFLSDDAEDQGSFVAGFPVLDWSQRLEKVLDEHSVQRVVVADPEELGAAPAEALVSARVRGLPVETARSFHERVTGRIEVAGLTNQMLMLEPGFRSGRLSRASKRALDIVVSALGLVLASPLLLAAGIAIRLDSGGPVFYVQQRLGARGHPFPIVKLRTMRKDAEERTGAVWCEHDDPRITRVGGVLRRSRLDELPQLWNVLRGEMSLVGPRPERPEFVSQLSASYDQFRLRTEIRPGITGWAQTRYGYVSDVDDYEQKLSLDLYYLKHRSLLFDLWILWETARTLLWMRGT